jgi:pyridoxine kinase
MARVLILSSYVAASRVGGGAQALALARLGLEPILVPTVLFGRHPGHGPPGGAAVDAATFEAVLGGVEAQGLYGGIDAVITGYFPTPEQVEAAVRTLDRVRAAAPSAQVVVDPVMGDEESGLYVREAVAEAVAARLAPRADVIAPNAWELSRLSGTPVADAASAALAARAFGRPTLVSSIRQAGQIGAVWADAGEAWLALHPAAATAPKGTGDLLTALFVAARLGGFSGPDALGLAVGGVADAVDEAAGLDELPLTALPTSLGASPFVSLARLDG